MCLVAGAWVVFGPMAPVSYVCGVTIMSSGGDFRCPVVGVCIGVVWRRVGVESVVMKRATGRFCGRVSVWVGWMAGRWCVLMCS